jgi:DNA-binding GntR family transcriptional regulator
MGAATATIEEARKAVSLDPVARNFSLKDHVHDQLRQAILDARIYEEATDLRLDERRLAEQLGISRTPVREALARLAQEGLVEIQPRKGVFILRKTRDEILEMITVWAALESMAARLATERASDGEINSLRLLASGYGADDALARIDDYSEANITFHQRILELSKCPMLKDIADGLFVHVRAVRSRAMHESDRVTRSVTDHSHIIEAIEARDGDLASMRVRDHTMGLHDHVQRTWRDFPEA